VRGLTAGTGKRRRGRPPGACPGVFARTDRLSGKGAGSRAGRFHAAGLGARTQSALPGPGAPAKAGYQDGEQKGRRKPQKPHTGIVIQ